jgi:hypothetical protein
MAKDYIEEIKDKCRNQITGWTTSNYGVVYGHRYQNFKYHACFAGLKRDFGNIPAGSDIQYLCQYNTHLFDYNKILNELREMFKEQFTIVRYYSGKKACRIFDIREKKISPKDVRYTGYYLLMNIFRVIDAEYRNKWQALKSRDNLKEYFPIDNIFDLLYFGNKYMYQAGHNINEDLYRLRPMKSGNIDYDYYGRTFPENIMLKDKGKEKLFRTAVQNYIDTIIKVFGKPINLRGKTNTIEKHVKETITYHSRYKWGSFKGAQSACFNFTEIIAKVVE